jgi:serine/threonine-protein kinase
MINKEGVAKLADMGLARAITDKEAAEAEAGKAFGTPYYISPEQIRGEVTVGPPADIYSLGATLYHMVTGNVPFDGKNPSAVMHKHLKADLVAPDHVNPKLSAGLAEIIEMMMAKAPAKRYQTCADLLVDLRAVRRGESPPIAHKELVPTADLASIAAAEAAAPAHLAEAEPESRPLVREPLVITLMVVAAVSITVNFILIVFVRQG